MNAKDHPLNLKSRRLLDKAKVAVDPEQQPFLQLMRWGQETGQMEFSRRHKATLQGTLEKLLASPEDKALEFLARTDAGEPRSLRAFEREDDPLQASALLWEELHSKLGATLPDYHRADQ
jgi:hypothetical protein